MILIVIFKKIIDVNLNIIMLMQKQTMNILTINVFKKVIHSQLKIGYQMIII